jgi:hypothetical protein
LASSRGIGVVEVKTQAVATGVCGYAATLGTCRLAGCPGRDDPSDHGPARLVAAAGASAVSALLAPKVCRALPCGYGNWREDSNPNCCLQDRSGSSTACWRVLSLLLGRVGRPASAL